MVINTMIKHLRRISVKIAEQLFPELTAIEMTLYLKSLQLQNLIGVEIGCQRCVNAYNIMRLLDMKKLYLVDPFDWYPGSTESETTKGSSVRSEAEHRIFRFGVCTQLIAKTSEDAISEIPNNLDFVYIDGNHSYPYVKKDIELYWPKIRNGGILGGHDYNAVYPGVSRAVNEFVEREGLELHGVNIDWWVIKK